MDEIILRLKGISALLVAISEINENIVISDFDMGIKLINNELVACINELETGI